jgi:hypothetical protein
VSEQRTRRFPPPWTVESNKEKKITMAPEERRFAQIMVLALILGVLIAIALRIYGY